MVKNRRQPVIEFQEKHKLKSECKPRKKIYRKKFRMYSVEFKWTFFEKRYLNYVRSN